ncbi:MAG: glycosyltransferase family 2 protein [Flavobacterium sp.]|nr:MAG: glycosyltransferase family 2 protein [Flavobacterium sp.]
MNDFVVSIIVPCYNQAQYLVECIQSILDQTYQSWECIIVNDESPDDTEKVALELCKQDDRIKYICQKNGGPSSARNNGISLAKGEYILPLDADDKIGERYLEEAINVFEKQASTSLVYCLAEKFGSVEEFWKLADFRYSELLKYNMIFCTALFRKSDWERVGGYDETLRKGWEDWEFWIRLLDEHSTVVKLESVHFYYRIREQSRQASMNNLDFEEIGWYIFLKHLPVYRKFFSNPIRMALDNADLQIENESLKNNLANVLTSTSYKLGNKMVSRLAFLKELQAKK